MTFTRRNIDINPEATRIGETIGRQACQGEFRANSDFEFFSMFVACG